MRALGLEPQPEQLMAMLSGRANAVDETIEFKEFLDIVAVWMDDNTRDDASKAYGISPSAVPSSAEQLQRNMSAEGGANAVIPLAHRGSWERLQEGSPSAELPAPGVTLAGPPIKEERDGDILLSPGQTAQTSDAGTGLKPRPLTGLRRNAESMAALSSMLSGETSPPKADAEPSAGMHKSASASSAELRLKLGGNNRGSQLSFSSQRTSSSGGFSDEVDEDALRSSHMQTNMTRRTASGTDIHYISFWEGHGGGHLIRDDSYQFAGPRRREQVKKERDSAKVAIGPLLRFLQHTRRRLERGKNRKAGGLRDASPVRLTQQVSGEFTAAGAPVREKRLVDLPDSCIRHILSMLGDVGSLCSCGLVCKKLRKLHRSVAASTLTLSAVAKPQGDALDSFEISVEDRDEKRFDDVVQGCLRHDVTDIHLGASTETGTRIMAQLAALHSGKTAPPRSSAVPAAAEPFNIPSPPSARKRRKRPTEPTTGLNPLGDALEIVQTEQAPTSAREPEPEPEPQVDDRSAPPGVTVPLAQLAEKLQLLDFSNNTQLISLEGLQKVRTPCR